MLAALVFSVWYNVSSFLGTWVPSFLNFGRFKSLESFNQRTNTYCVSKVESMIEGCIDRSGRRWRYRRDKGSGGHQGKISFLGGKLEGRSRWGF